MFDLAFGELLVIALVLLIVVGPQRLPEVARTGGRWVGRAQRMVNKVKNDIMQDESVQQAQEMHGKMRQDIGAVRQAVDEAGTSVEQEWLQQRYQKPEKAPATQPMSVEGENNGRQ